MRLQIIQTITLVLITIITCTIGNNFLCKTILQRPYTALNVLSSQTTHQNIIKKYLLEAAAASDQLHPSIGGHGRHRLQGGGLSWFIGAFTHKMYVQSTRSSFVFSSEPDSEFCRSQVGSLREARGRGVPFPPSSSPLGALSRVLIPSYWADHPRTGGA